MRIEQELNKERAAKKELDEIYNLFETRDMVVISISKMSFLRMSATSLIVRSVLCQWLSECQVLCWAPLY